MIITAGFTAYNEALTVLHRLEKAERFLVMFAVAGLIWRGFEAPNGILISALALGLLALFYLSGTSFLLRKSIPLHRWRLVVAGILLSASCCAVFLQSTDYSLLRFETIAMLCVNTVFLIAIRAVKGVGIVGKRNLFTRFIACCFVFIIQMAAGIFQAFSTG